MKANFFQKMEGGAGDRRRCRRGFGVERSRGQRAIQKRGLCSAGRNPKNIWTAGASIGESLSVFGGGRLAEENRRLRAQASGFWAQQAQIEALKKRMNFCARD